jgi:hypothetical protein
VFEEIKIGDLIEVEFLVGKRVYELNIGYLVLRSCQGVVLHTQTISVDMPLFSQSTKQYRCQKGIDRL